MKKALIIGASKGLGLAIVKQYLARGWSVVGTVRQKSGTELHELLPNSSGHLRVEHLDVNDETQITSLKQRLQSEKFDLLFVNAGVSNGAERPIAEVSKEEFTNVLITNALSPMKVIEALQTTVVDNGTIGAMSSGLGSIADNEKGGWEAYRASKAALNTLMRSYAARHIESKRTLLLIAPGWIRTDMGGSNATYSVDEAIPRVVDTINAQAGKPGLQYLD